MFWEFIENKYLPQLLSFLEELRKREFLVIACSGICRNPDLPEKEALREAKAPVNIPKGYEYRFAERDLRITESTIRLISEKKALAFGLPGAPNKLLILDIDVNATFLMAGLHELDRKTVDVNALKQLSEIVQDMELEDAVGKAQSFLTELGFDFDKVYIEVSPRGGMHIMLRLESTHDYSLACNIPGAKSYLDNKLHGYVVAYPSILAIKRVESGREGYRIYYYSKESSVDVWDTDFFTRYVKAVTRLVNLFSQFVLVYTASTSTKGELRYTRVPDRVADLVSKLPLDLALRFFYRCCVAAGCNKCVRYYVEKLLRNEPWEVVNPTYPVKTSRGLHFVLENELLGAMWLLGFSEDQIYAVAERIRYKDYEPETPPTEAAKNIIRYGERWLSIARKGACPFLVANELHCRPYNPCCPYKLTFRISQLVASKLDLVIAILKSLLREHTSHANC